MMALSFTHVFLLVSVLVCLTGGAEEVEPDTSGISKCDRTVDVAIVGAGPAGTYAAYKLKDANKTIEILEYSNRIGGRLYTTSLPNLPDVSLELGALWFLEGKHARVERLVKEMGLIKSDFLQGIGKKDNKNFFLRGKFLTWKDIKNGDLPFELSPEEKANQANLISYYLEKLTGFNESVLKDEQVLKLKVKDGRELYKLSIKEALDMVATEEGKELIRSTSNCDSLIQDDVSAVALFHDLMGETAQGAKGVTIKSGMSTLAEELTNNFLRASDRHKLTLNKQLEAIKKLDDGTHQLELRKTYMMGDFIRKRNLKDRVCAKKVILAIPQRALTELDWKPLRSEKVQEALRAVRMVNASAIYMSFPKAWWLSDDALNATDNIRSDAPFSQMYHWKSSNSSDDFEVIASFADKFKAKYLQVLNMEGGPVSGSASGPNKVSINLKNELLIHLSQAFGIDRAKIPEPSSAIAQFWSDYPTGGGWSVWKAGYHFDDVRQTIQRPSLTDDIFIVGSDHAFSVHSVWTESALSTVDDVFDKYAL